MPLRSVLLPRRESTLAPGSLESHQRLTVQGKWSAEARTLGKGALFVPIAQPKARLVMALLEPTAPDSRVEMRWNGLAQRFYKRNMAGTYTALGRGPFHKRRRNASGKRYRLKKGSRTFNSHGP